MSQPPPARVAPLPLEHRIGIAALGGPGFALAGGPIAWRVGARLEFLVARPNARLSVVLIGPFAVSNWSATLSFGSTSVTTSATSFEVTPALRFEGQVLPVLSFYGDLGVGLVIVSTLTTARFVGYSGSSNAGFQLRTATGARLALSERFSLFLEPLAFDFTLMGTTTTFVGGFPVVSGGGFGTRYTVAFGATFKL